MPARAAAATLRPMSGSVSRGLSMAIAALAALLVLDLALPWQRLTVGGAVGHLQSTTSGLHGWGLVAAVVALVLLAHALLELTGAIELDRMTELGPAALAAATLLATVARFREVGAASIGWPLGGFALEREWEATAGLALAAALVLLAVGRVVARRPAFHGRTPAALGR